MTPSKFTVNAPGEDFSFLSTQKVKTRTDPLGDPVDQNEDIIIWILIAVNEDEKGLGGQESDVRHL